MPIQPLLGPLQGLQMNRQKFADHADRISKWGMQDADGNFADIDLGTEIAGTIVAQRGFEANLAVMKTEDEMLGTLIDVLA